MGRSVPDVLNLAGVVLFGLAACQDLGWRLVPNAVPLAIATVGFASRAIDGTVLAGMAASLAVFAAASACWRRGWLGGADVKLFAAGALLAPPAAVSGFILCSAVAGGLLALVYWILGRLVGIPSASRPSGLTARILRVECWRLRRGGPLPYAVALCLGISFTLIRI